MALFSYPLPMTTRDQLENLYYTCGVDRAVVLDLASDFETPEAIWGGHCRAYVSFFETCGLSFPIPEKILEMLAELGQLLAMLVRAREEILSFELDELRHLFRMKHNKQSPGTFLMSLRPGRHVIGGTPYRDEKWREQFFVFKVDSASMGVFDFSKLPRLWAEDIGRCVFSYNL
ncbi:hypothetical protein Bca101_082996 [Brassica carinata]